MKNFGKANDFGPKGWKVVIFALCCYTFGGFLTDGMNSLYGIFGQMYGWERTAMATWISIGGWVSIVTVLICGALAHKIGPKRMITIGFAGQLVTFTLLATLKSITMFAVAAICNSVSLAFITGFGIQLLGSNWFPKKKGVYMGICTMGLIISVTFLNAVIGFFMNKFGTPVAYFIFSMVVYGLMLVFTVFCVHDNPEDEGAFPDNESNFDHEEQAKILAAAKKYKETSPWTIKKMLTCKDTWLIGLGFGMVNLMGGGVNGQIYPAMMSWGFERDKIAVFLILALIPAVIYSWGGGLIDNKWGPKKATIWFVSLSCVLGCVMIFLAKGNRILYFVGLMLAMSSTSAGNNMTMSITSSKFGRYDFANAWTVIHVISKVVASSGAVVVSSLADLPGGYDSAYGALAVITVVSMGILALINDKFVGRTDTEIKQLMDSEQAAASTKA